jgi:hypothetical protein
MPGGKVAVGQCLRELKGLAYGVTSTKAERGLSLPRSSTAVTA